MVIITKRMSPKSAVRCSRHATCHVVRTYNHLSPQQVLGQVSMCRSVSDHSIRRPTTCTLLLSLASMPSETKESLIAKIAAYGEHLSPELTVLQLKGRLAELKSKAEASGLTTLKDQLKMLSKKSKKRPELVQHLKELGLEPTANQTIAQMYVMAETFLIKNAPPSPLDTVGFGQFAGLTYGQVMQDHPQYCQWVITTSKETDTCWRLARLATWLMSTNNQEHAEIPKSSKTKNVNKTAQLGHKAPGKGYHQESAASEPGSWTQCSSMEGDEMQRLKDELEVLRQENLDLQQQMGRGKSRREM